MYNVYREEMLKRLNTRMQRNTENRIRILSIELAKREALKTEYDKSGSASLWGRGFVGKFDAISTLYRNCEREPFHRNPLTKGWDGNDLKPGYRLIYKALITVCGFTY